MYPPSLDRSRIEERKTSNNSSRNLEDELEEEPHTANGDEDESEYKGNDVYWETGSRNEEKVTSTNSSGNLEQELEEEPHTVNGEGGVRWHGSPWEEIEH